jgi:peptidoglycan/xylan/chitin deacetylase (PgdA/CDA1 family)
MAIVAARLTVAVALSGAIHAHTPGALLQSFQWPEGKRAAVSLSFDDGRESQIDMGLPLLKRLGLKVTFYVNPAAVEKRLHGWKQAAADGHEIANHSLTHPCTGNYAFSAGNALENYDLTMMARQLDGANERIQQLLGITPSTFAYPCGLKFVGRGREVRSYVPLVAERFVVGRGYLDEAPNDPAGDGHRIRQHGLRADESNRRWSGEGRPLGHFRRARHR